MSSVSQIGTQCPPREIFVGCSGWAYPTWKPDFYPAKVPARKFLEYYATQLNSVEVNYTFRSLPTTPMLESWLSATPESFRFSFKAPQRVTHASRLKDCGDATRAFAAAIKPVIEAGRFGTTLFQLPPNFKADTSRLATFLEDSASSKLRIAFEFRHESWFDDEIFSILKKHNAALCVAESDELQTPEVRTADFICYRLRRSDYAADEIRAVCDRLHASAQSGDVFAYFKHEDEPTGALRAVAVMKGLQDA